MVNSFTDIDLPMIRKALQLGAMAHDGQRRKWGAKEPYFVHPLRVALWVMVATHDPAVVKQADRTLYLRHGALEAEAGPERILSVIDAAGRIQLPPEALRLFPDRRAVIDLQEGEVRITPP